MTNKSLESGSYNTDNYTEIFMCVYTHTQKHPCQPSDADMGRRKKKKKTNTFSND